MKCYTILYARKSTEEDDRQTLSLDAQERECRAFAARMGLAIDAVIREAHSARKPGRPLFSKMLKDAKRFRNRGTSVKILCHKPDRLLRNITDWASINELNDDGVEFLFLTGSYENNAQGKMAFGMNVVFAKYYVDNLSEEVKKGMREKLMRGEWPYLAPVGYRNVRDAKGARVVVDDVTAPLVVRAFELYASGGFSIARLASRMADEGLRGKSGRPLSLNAVHTRILTNPFYCGIMRTNGETYVGTHQPIISADLFERVQERVRGMSFARKETHAFDFNGLIRCGRCGSAIVGELKKRTYVYYRCGRKRGGSLRACPQGYVRGEDLTTLLRDAVGAKIQFRAEFIALIRTAAKKMASNYQERAENELPKLKKELAAVERQLSVLIDLRLNGNVTDEEYKSKRESLVLRQMSLQERLSKLSREHPHDTAAAVERLGAVCEQLPTLLSATGGELRELLNLVGSNYVLVGKVATFEPLKLFTTASEIQQHPQWWATVEDIPNFFAELARTAPQLDAVHRLAIERGILHVDSYSEPSTKSLL